MTNFSKTDKSSIMKEHRCNNCNDLLFNGILGKGTTIEIMCKKPIKREIQKENSKIETKWKKCKTINIFKSGE